MGELVDVSVNWTESGAVPEVVDAEKLATGTVAVELVVAALTVIVVI